MGGCEVSMSAEVFDLEKRSRLKEPDPCKISGNGIGCTGMGFGERWNPVYAMQVMELVRRGRMAELRGDEGQGGVAGTREEQWSPIRGESSGAAAAQSAVSYNRFSGEENGASSDMDTDEDPIPLDSSKRRKVIADGSVDDRGGFATTVGIATAVSNQAGEAASNTLLRTKKLSDDGTNYEGLARESTTIPQQVVRNWSRCHSQSFWPITEPWKEACEREARIPSLVGRSEETSSIFPASYWTDKPSKKENEVQETQDVSSLENRDEEKEVPLYDRASMFVLSCDDSADCSDGFSSVEEASRCFNCGSYSHSLSTCSRPRDVGAISSARKELQDKRGCLTRLHSSSRYYQCSPGGKFEDIRPGVLGLETRKVLGIGELDPPPWLNRMRELGCPPGYLEDSDGPSGVEIFGEDNEDDLGNEVLEKSSPAVDEPGLCTGRKMMVEFPGINAPIPDNADMALWAPKRRSSPEQPARGARRFFHQMSQVYCSPESGLSPSPSGIPHSGYSRDGSTSSADVGSPYTNGSLGMEYRAGGSSPSSWAFPSPVVDRHCQPEMSPLSAYGSNEAWLKAQAALGALQPN